MKRVSRKKKHEQYFKFKNAIFSHFHTKCTMQLSSETKEQMKGFSFDMSLQIVSTPNNRGFYNWGRLGNQKFPVGKENILKKISKKKKTHVVHSQLVYVRGMYIMLTTYVHVLYREYGMYTSIHFQKKKKFGHKTWAREAGRNLEGDQRSNLT